jgi:uncharacterized protein (TIGR02246 family)
MNDTREIELLYRGLLDGWNRRDAESFGNSFTTDGVAIGFDGSRHAGRAEITADMARIFADHETAAYVARVREVRLLTPDVGLLEAVAGLVPPGGSDLRPELNARQTVVACFAEDEGWRIAQLQNTPAQFHGRPDLAAALTDELRRELRSGAGE